jgi:hypothetical protein
MARSAGLALLVVALVLPISGSAFGATHAQTRCAGAGSTLAANSQFRVYAIRVKTGDRREPRTFGCVRSSGRRTRLDLRCHPAQHDPVSNDECTDKPARVLLRGRWCALEFRDFGGDGGSYTTIVRADLRGGVGKFTIVLDDQLDSKSPIVDRLFVSPRGGLAYAADDLNEGEGRTGVVGYLPPPKGGKNVRDSYLDFDPGVEGASLRVSGGLIRWRNRGTEQTAPWR